MTLNVLHPQTILTYRHVVMLLSRANCHIEFYYWLALTDTGAHLAFPTHNRNALHLEGEVIHSFEFKLPSLSECTITITMIFLCEIIEFCSKSPSNERNDAQQNKPFSRNFKTASPYQGLFSHNDCKSSLAIMKRSQMCKLHYAINKQPKMHRVALHIV